MNVPAEYKLFVLVESCRRLEGSAQQIEHEDLHHPLVIQLPWRDVHPSMFFSSSHDRESEQGYGGHQKYEVHNGLTTQSLNDQILFTGICPEKKKKKTGGNDGQTCFSIHVCDPGNGIHCTVGSRQRRQNAPCCCLDLGMAA